MHVPRTKLCKLVIPAELLEGAASSVWPSMLCRVAFDCAAEAVYDLNALIAPVA